jgi:hypothetical protein
VGCFDEEANKLARAFGKSHCRPGKLVTNKLAKASTGSREWAVRAHQHTPETPSILVEDVLVLNFDMGCCFFVEKNGERVSMIMPGMNRVLLRGF